jgi:hypothetical protein
MAGPYNKIEIPNVKQIFCQVEPNGSSTTGEEKDLEITAGPESDLYDALLPIEAFTPRD